MQMCLFWYLAVEYCLHKMIMIFGEGSIYGDVYILIFTEESIYLHKMIMIFGKGSIYADVFILIFTEEIIYLHKMIMIFDQRINICKCVYFDIYRMEYCYIKSLWYVAKDQYMEMCIFWYLQRRVFFT